IERQARPGVIRLTARRADGALELVVADNGPGPAEGDGRRGGIGLANTRERLAQLYGAAGSLTLRPRAGGGTEAVLRVPWRAAGPDMTPAAPSRQP
ncbi:MAG TPA: hypothetical protein PKE47_06175, partial [Verrucomicrobiota bacterium]|nr:hypothetical protein [Verrucomicrobiota bacterium]